MSLSYIFKKNTAESFGSDFHLNFAIGNSLAVQWLALCALAAKGLIQEFRSLKPLGETKKKKKGLLGKLSSSYPIYEIVMIISI